VLGQDPPWCLQRPRRDHPGILEPQQARCLRLSVLSSAKTSRAFHVPSIVQRQESQSCPQSTSILDQVFGRIFAVKGQRGNILGSVDSPCHNHSALPYYMEGAIGNKLKKKKEYGCVLIKLYLWTHYHFRMS
jgi:hypothetical protein